MIYWIYLERQCENNMLKLRLKLRKNYSKLDLLLMKPWEEFKKG